MNNIITFKYLYLLLLMKTLSNWLITGVCSVSLLLGFLIGASSSPIAGTVIAAILGGVGTLWATRLTRTSEATKDAPKVEPLILNSRVLGISLTLLAGSFLGGTLMGAATRIGLKKALSKPESQLTIPWEGSKTNLPEDPQEAWKWLTFSKDASALGLSPDEIKSIYHRAKAVNSKAAVSSFMPLRASTTPTWPSYTMQPQKVEAETEDIDFTKFEIKKR